MAGGDAPQALALRTLCAHYPIFWERGGRPLEYGAPLPLALRWQEEGDGSQRLVAGVETEASVQLLHGARLWYLLPAAARFGPVNAEPEALRLVQVAPRVQPEQVPALRTLLDRRAKDLPLPVDRGPVRVLDADPTPVLTLHALGPLLGAVKDARTGFARLSFRYDGVCLPTPDIGASVSRVLHQDQVVEIHRQGGVERRWSSALGRAGFEHADWRAFTIDGLRPDDWLLKATHQRLSRPVSDWLECVDGLQAQGFQVEYADGIRHEQEVAIDDWNAELEPAGNAWFDVTLGIDVAGERMDLLPILRGLVTDPRFPLEAAKGERPDATWRVPLGDMRYLQLPLAKLRALIEPLLEWLQTESSGAARVHRTQAAALDATGLWHGNEALRRQMEILLRHQRPSAPPKGLLTTLRPYQLDGLTWLDFLAEAGLGGILADDMGLGKTVQVLAHLLAEKQRGRLNAPALVVCPTSLVGNWQAEAERFAPALKVTVLHGADRAERFDELAGHDLAITTYPLLPRDVKRLQAARFSLLILDEAQAIKNAASQAARVVRKIPATRRLALTGTPLENHLGELWAEFDAVEPGLLGNQRQFTRLYRTPIEKQGDGARQQLLNRRVGALLLRRRKDDVLTELPPKTEIVRMLELEGEQRALHEALRLAQHQRVQQAVAARGLAKSGIIVLDALLKLRQACCDPRLVKLDSAKKVKVSAKLQALLELLDSLLPDGRRILLFSQFTEMLALIEAALAQRKIACQTLTGQTPARTRTALVKKFQQGSVPLFLICLKAGGTGLNLTAADTVIQYDPWWNPAVEAQATDRAYRIGQDKPVFVYRLICKGTVEEKIHALQTHKSELAQAVLEGGGATRRLRFDADDLDALFAAA